MLGMIGALLVIWVGFDIYSGMVRPGEGLFGGSFLTPRNLWILLVQTSSIAVMTTGMVLIIVMRQIDLSVGSMLSLIAVSTGYAAGLQARPRAWRRPRSDLDHRRAVRARSRRADRLLQRRTHRLSPAFRPSSSRSAASSRTAAWPGGWLRGETVAPMDKTFTLIGGNGPLASIGPIWSWVVGRPRLRRHRRRDHQRPARSARRFKFPQRPIWAETFLVGRRQRRRARDHLRSSIPIRGRRRSSRPTPRTTTSPFPQGVLDTAGDAICMAADKVVRCADGLIY